MRLPTKPSLLISRALRGAARRSVLLVGMLVLLTAGTVTHAQNRTVETVSNEFVKAHVTTASRAGRFWITAGPRYRDSIRFLYATNPSFVTSNLVFRVSRGNDVNFYCNHPKGYLPWQPTAANGIEATFKPYDTMIVRQDTILMMWRGMAGYDVTMRIIAEKPSTIYDSGGDLLLEFSYKLAEFAPAGELGIFMMFDTFNSQGGSSDGGGVGDEPSVMTSNGYLPVNKGVNNVSFTGAGVPEWYHVGNFEYRDPINDIFPIHRLTGRSHGGRPLTPPNLLAIGNWYMLRSLAWELPGDFNNSGFGDCATIVRWEGLAGEGVVRTAFGLNDKEGNQNFTCRDDNLFVDIKAPRLISQAVKNGPYSLSEFDVEMWVSNLSTAMPVQPTIRLQTPISSYPSFPMPGNRLILDSAVTAAAQSIYLAPKQTKKITWRLRVNTASTDTLTQLAFFVRYGQALERRFLEDCAPKITVKGWQEPPPPPDTLAPVIELVDAGRAASVYWNFRLYDRHPGYQWDVGMKHPIEVIASENIDLVFSPEGFPSCDTSQTVGLTATVTDTARQASLVFRVTDCAGNDSVATIAYSPRPDPFTPQVFTVGSGRIGDCDWRHFDITLVDSTHKGALAGDHGFGTAVLLYADNFNVVINGGRPIMPFDKVITVTADVIDTMRIGGFALRVFDFAGNDTAITYGSCTYPDTKEPVSLVTPLGNGRFSVTTSDVRAWDRGLRDIEILSRPPQNMRIVAPPTIAVGDPFATFEVEAIDPTQPGSITLEIRDTIFLAEPSGHADTLVIDYIPGVDPPKDTIAPDIAFAPRSGSNGAKVITTVDEEHYVNGELYPHDTGLEEVWVLSQTPNIRLGSAISFIAGAIVTTFEIEVIDTLAIGLRDSIVIGARDRAGNVSTSTFSYPIQPDTRAPLFVGVMDPERTSITAVISDDRSYDRGLGSITIENPVNIALRGAAPNIRGRDADTLRFDVTDPLAPVSGTFVLRDLVGVVDQTPEGGLNHVTRIPFSLPSVAIEIALPEQVEGGDDVVAAIIARTAIGDDVDSLGFTLDYGTGAAPIADWRISRIVTTSVGEGSLGISMIPDVQVAPGDTIGTLRFPTTLRNEVQQLRVAISNPTVNGGRGRLVSTRVGSDDELSVLSLPPALIRVSGDSVVYINGDCERILTGRRTAAKPNALAILGMRPQPVVRDGGAPLELDLRNLPAGGARAELVALDGTIAARADVDGGSQPLERRAVTFADVPQGTYVLRLTATTGVDQVMVVVVE